MYRLALLFLLIASAWHPLTRPNPALLRSVKDSTQSGVRISSQTPIYTFGSQVIFRANLQSDQAPEQTLLYVSARTQDVRIYPQTPAADGSLVYQLDLKQDALRPFTRVYYWYKVKLPGTPEVTSPSFWFDYTDNRFTWQTLDSNLFRIHWIDGDAAFAQSVLEVAQTGFKVNQGILPVAPPASPIDIYVYSHAKDLQSALDLGGMTWVAGHASPDLGVVWVSLPQGPDQRLQMEQQVPHELSHVLIYQITGSAYSRLPAWLVEGLASMVELYPNSDYPLVIEVARQKKTLLSMSALCQEFPRDASNAYLAYAESESFMRYLNTTYGVSGIQHLIQRYLDGMGCSEGASAALGVSLNTLDNHWQKEVLGVNITSLALDRLLPYFVPVALVVIPFVGVGLYYRYGKKQLKHA